eukprot:m.81432 g.81432  ORF g.81432 m.81432 type:complete len:511 (-) comp14572_c0_seq1:754-2286(-)
MSSSKLLEVVIRRHTDDTFGFELEQATDDEAAAILIKNLNPSSPAGATGKMSDGMRVLSIASRDIQGYSLSSAKNLLRTRKDIITIGLAPNGDTSAVTPNGINWAIAGQAKPGDASYLPTRSDRAKTLHIPLEYERVQILYNFRGSRDDELDLNRDDIVHVTRRGEDGWCVGECQRTHKTGAFPATYAIRLRPTQKEVESIYSDVEQLGVMSGNNDYEELPGAQAGSSPVPYDYGEHVGPDTPVATEGGNYSSIDGGTLSPTSAGILYAVVDRNATEVNGDVYATVNKREDPVYTLLPNEAGAEAADSQAADDPKYAAPGSLPRMTILVSDSPYARLPGEEDGSSLYARLPADQLPEEGASGAAPTIPERRYDLESMLEVSVAVSLDQNASERDSMTYESLPNDKLPQVGEDLYEDLPAVAGGEEQPPALPDRPADAVSRKPSLATGLDEKQRKKQAAEERKRAKMLKAQLKRDQKAQAKIEKLQKAEEKRKEKEREKLEKKRRKSGDKA